ncbi:MAG TPA: hypothetical protein VGS80_22885 [Ktedonobacterales bacterium]|nr:hypothetical protein [Ktedonobacterales bacterium]
MAAEFGERGAFVVPCLPERRIERNGAVKCFERLLVPVQSKQQRAPVVPGLGRIGDSCLLLLEGGEGRRELTVGGEGDGLRVKDAGREWLRCQCLIVGRDGILEVGDPGERAALAGPRLHVLGIERQCPVIGGEGFAVTVERGESDTEGAPGHVRTRVGLHRPLQTSERFRMATLDKEFLAMVEIIDTPPDTSERFSGYARPNGPR